MITSQLSRQTYAGTGSVGPFGFTFKIFNPATDLKVTKLSALGVETPLAYLADYTVAGIKSGVDAYGAGGTVTLNVALAAGESLTIRRVPPNVQGLSVQNAGPFFPKGYEDQLDYLVMLVQAHEDTLSRVLQMKETTDLTTGISPVLPAPSANLLLGWDATGKKVVNSAPLAGPAGPAGVGGPIPIFADTASRDVFYPVPAPDNLARVKSRGYDQRFGAPASGANKWLDTVLTRDAGPVITANSKGIVGDGVTDDAPFLAAADVAAVASGGRHELDLSVLPTRCTINSDLTLTAPFHPNIGSGSKRIWVTAGKTLTIVGAFNPSTASAVFDPTMPGRVSFVGNRSVHTYNAKWFGILGDGVTNDQPALEFMVNSIPDYAAVLFPNGMSMLLLSTWQVADRAGIRFFTQTHPFPNGTDAAPSFIWNGPPAIIVNDAAMNAGSAIVTSATGGFTNALVGQQAIVYGALTNGVAGLRGKVVSVQSGNQLTLDTPATATVVGQKATFSGIMIYVDRCPFVEFEGFAVFTDDIPGARTPANIGFEIDNWNQGPGVRYGFGTETGVIHCLIENYHRNPNFVGIRISEVSFNNQEYHHIRYNRIQGGGLRQHQFTSGLSITAGTNVLTCANPVFSPTDVTASPPTRVRISNVGAGGGVLDTHIVGYTSPTQVTLAINATGTAAGVNGVIDESLGIGVRIGGSFNAKRIELHANSIVNCAVGLQMSNGSAYGRLNSYTFCDIDRQIIEASEPVNFNGDNSEHAGQGLVTSAHPTVSFYACRFDPSETTPNGGYIQTLAPAKYVLLDVVDFDSVMAYAGSTFFKIADGSVLHCRGCQYPFATRAQMGVDDATMAQVGSATFIDENGYGCTDNIGAPFPSSRNVDWRRYQLLRVDNVADNTAGVDRSAIRASMRPGSPVADAAAIKGSVAQFNPSWGDITDALSAFQADIAQEGDHYAFIPYVGFRAIMPKWNSAESIDSATAFLVETAVPSGAGVLTLGYGLRIKPTGAMAGWGISQEGPADKNLLRGITQFDTNIIEKATAYVDVVAGGNTTPNASGGMVYRYRAAGGITINAPTGAAKGNPLKIIIFNNTAGAVTPTMNAAFLGSGFGAIGAGKSRSRHYVYDDVRAAWEPIGAVSEDF